MVAVGAMKAVESTPDFFAFVCSTIFSNKAKAAYAFSTRIKVVLTGCSSTKSLLIKTMLAFVS